MLIDIVYENGPIKFFCISAVLMLDVSIDTGLRTFLHLISIYKYSRFVVFDVFDRQGNFSPQCYLHAIWLELVCQFARRAGNPALSHKKPVGTKYLK